MLLSYGADLLFLNLWIGVAIRLRLRWSSSISRISLLRDCGSNTSLCRLRISIRVNRLLFADFLMAHHLEQLLYRLIAIPTHVLRENLSCRRLLCNRRIGTVHSVLRMFLMLVRMLLHLREIL